MTDEPFFDLYLYSVNQVENLTKIPHLSREDAKKYSLDWLEMNELHDYILVIEGSKPWYEPEPTITIKTPEWIVQEYNKLNEEY